MKRLYSIANNIEVAKEYLDVGALYSIIDGDVNQVTSIPEMMDKANHLYFEIDED